MVWHGVDGMGKVKFAWLGMILKRKAIMTDDRDDDEFYRKR